VASPDYLRRHGTPATPDELAGHNCLCYTLDERPFEWTFLQPDGAPRPVPVRGMLRANTGIALRSAAVAGLGIAASASFIVHEHLRRGELVAVLPGYPLRPRALYAMYPQNRHLSPKVRAFVDFAAEIYRRPAWDFMDQQQH
jgi:DNA-binding transcriptional LysR family regulator